MVTRTVNQTEFLRFLQALTPKTAYVCVGDGVYSSTPAQIGRWVWCDGNRYKVAYDNVGTHPLSLKSGYKWVNWGAPFPGTSYQIQVTGNQKHYRRQTDMTDQPRQPPDWNFQDVAFTWASMIIPRWWDTTFTLDWVKAYINTGVINNPTPANKYQSKDDEIHPIYLNDLMQNVTPFYIPKKRRP